MHDEKKAAGWVLVHGGFCLAGVVTLHQRNAAAEGDLLAQRGAVGVPVGGDLSALPRPGWPPGRQRWRVGRIDEPVGDERLHHAGPQPPPDAGAGLCAGVQLVGLVRKGGPSSGSREAITSRPLRLSALGRPHRGGQNTRYLTPMHGTAVAEPFKTADPGAGRAPAGVFPPYKSNTKRPPRAREQQGRNWSFPACSSGVR